MEKYACINITRDTLWRWIWVVIFAIGFACVESAVVVYLREIFYEGGFYFPMKFNWQDMGDSFNKITRIELAREFATIVMLVAIGWASGKSRLQKFSFFIIAFGVWDIFYYVWLRVMTGWPESIMTWDILFLLPLPWVGPVITPVMIALAMIAAGSLIIYFEEKGHELHFTLIDWVVILGFGLLMIIAFCWDWKNIARLPDGVERSGMPNPFLWELFLPAYLFSVFYFAIRLWTNISKK